MELFIAVYLQQRAPFCPRLANKYNLRFNKSKYCLYFFINSYFQYTIFNVLKNVPNTSLDLKLTNLIQNYTIISAYGFCLPKLFKFISPVMTTVDFLKIFVLR